MHCGQGLHWTADRMPQALRLWLERRCHREVSPEGCGALPAMPTAFRIRPSFFTSRECPAICRMLLWNLHLYSLRSSWFEIIAALFYELNLKRLVTLDNQDDNLDARDSHGAQEGEASE